MGLLWYSGEESLVIVEIIVIYGGGSDENNGIIVIYNGESDKNVGIIVMRGYFAMLHSIRRVCNIAKLQSCPKGMHSLCTKRQITYGLTFA